MLKPASLDVERSQIASNQTFHCLQLPKLSTSTSQHRNEHHNHFMHIINMVGERQWKWMNWPLDQWHYDDDDHHHHYYHDDYQKWSLLSLSLWSSSSPHWHWELTKTTWPVCTGTAGSKIPALVVSCSTHHCHHCNSISISRIFIIILAAFFHHQK